MSTVVDVPASVSPSSATGRHRVTPIGRRRLAQNAVPVEEKSLKVLVYSASMGAGHDGAARELRSRLEARGHTVEILDFADAMPFRFGYGFKWIYEQQLAHAPETYEWVYHAQQDGGWVFTTCRILANLGRRTISKEVKRSGADVVVGTYPLIAQCLGALRKRGRLKVPAMMFMTDHSAHPIWTHSYMDLHVTVSPQTAEVAAQLSGRPAIATGPMVPQRFFAAAQSRDGVDGHRTAVRESLGLAPEAVVALVVAGSWGVGDVDRSVNRLLAGSTPGSPIVPMVVCGKNEALLTDLSSREGLLALGWRSDMHDLMLAADVLVENAGGLSANEAFAAGLPVVSHECLPGHGRHNATVMDAGGLTTYVTDPAQLVPVVRELAAPGSPRAAAQRAAASAIFAGDPAIVTEVLGRTNDVAAAVASAHAPASTAKQQLRRAAPSKGAIARRRGRRVVVGAAAVFALGTTGVAAATSMGVGVVDAQRQHRDEVFLVLRLTPGDAQLMAMPDSIATLRATDATVAVDGVTVEQFPAAVKTLADAGVPLVSGGAGTDGGVHPTRAHSDIVRTNDQLAALTGIEPKVFVACRSLSAVDLGTAALDRSRVVRPDAILRSPADLPANLTGGRILLVDGRSTHGVALIDELTTLRNIATADGLSVGPLSEVVAGAQ